MLSKLLSRVALEGGGQRLGTMEPFERFERHNGVTRITLGPYPNSVYVGPLAKAHLPRTIPESYESGIIAGELRSYLLDYIDVVLVRAVCEPCEAFEDSLAADRRWAPSKCTQLLSRPRKYIQHPTEDIAERVANLARRPI